MIGFKICSCGVLYRVGVWNRRRMSLGERDSSRKFFFGSCGA